MLLKHGIEIGSAADSTGCSNGLYGRWLITTLQFSWLHAGKS